MIVGVFDGDGRGTVVEFDALESQLGVIVQSTMVVAKCSYNCKR
jgi:hypothetical protein